jgi:Mycothiol maleylpyruvate isomerase N-terminal domain
VTLVPKTGLLPFLHRFPYYTTRNASWYETFTACVARPAAALFLRQYTEWTPRDVVAHLIGWNHYTKTGCEQIKQGMVPFYLADADDDFRHVNALSVQTYAWAEKHTLIEALLASFQELLRFLSTVSPEEWETDYGVRYQGEPVTIANTVGALSSDYLAHTKDIEIWVTSRNG